MKNYFISGLTFLIAILFVIPANSQENWTKLFNGKNLDGWEVLKGEADFNWL